MVTDSLVTVRGEETGDDLFGPPISQQEEITPVTSHHTCSLPSEPPPPAPVLPPILSRNLCPVLERIGGHSELGGEWGCCSIANFTKHLSRLAVSQDLRERDMDTGAMQRETGLGISI